ncbi:MAG: hypothetical protein RLZZ522_2230, partial [Verrucomicrobiota bacterium]
MKLKQINVGLAAAVAITLVQSVSASVVVAGFYSFENMKPVTSTDDTVDYINPDYAGVSGWVTSPRQASQADNGSYDTTYGGGSSTLPSQPGWGYSNIPGVPSAGDGMGNIKAQGEIPAQGQPDYSVLSFWVTNTGDPLPLDRIYFDLAANPPAGSESQRVVTKYYIGAFDPMQSDNYWWGMGTSYGTVGGYALPITTSQNNYNDYSARLGLILGTGETVAFMFSGLTVSNPGSYLPKSLYVDN